MTNFRSLAQGASFVAMSTAFLFAAPALAQTAGPSAGTVPATPAADAQDAKPATPAPSDPVQTDTAYAGNDIVVTARKTAERLLDVPIAITALGPQALLQKNVSTISGLSTVVPNLTYSTGINQPLLFVRGFGSGTNAGFDQSVAKFVNNVYLGRDQDGRLPIFDVERLEVLKGPQVMAFGNSATAGAINVTTRTPGKDFAGDLNASYEFYDQEVKLQGGITVPISSDASLRFAGYLQNLYRGENYNALLDRHEVQLRNWAGRTSFRWDAAPGIHVKLMGEYDSIKSLGSGIQAVRQPLSPTGPRYPEVDDPSRNDNDYTGAPNFGNNESILHHGIGVMDLSFDVLGGTLVSTTAYRAERNEVNLGNPGSNNLPVSFLHSLQKYNQYSQELRFNGSFGLLDLTLGAYYERTNLHIDQVNTYTLGNFGATGVSATPLARVTFFDQRANKYSANIDTTWHLGGGFSVSAGVRYSRYEKNAVQELIGTTIPVNMNFNTTRSYLRSLENATIEAGPLTTVSGGRVHYYPNLRLTEDHFQPQFMAQYKFGENMIYAKYTSGFKAGGFDFNYSSNVPNGIQFGAERGQLAELGFKGTTADRKFDYTVAVFRETFTNLQFSVFVGTGFIVTNVGEARSQGIEVEANLRPVQGLRFSFNGSLLDPKYVSYPNAACNTNQVLVTPSGCLQDLSGHQLQYTSKASGTLGVDYEKPVGDYIVGGGVSVFARSSFSTSATDDPFGLQHGFVQLDGHLDLKPANSKWTAQLFARNLTNIRYLNYVAAPPGNGTSLISGYERGRQIGLQLGVKF